MQKMAEGFGLAATGMFIFLQVRVNCLLCLGQLLDHMDKWFVLDEILPFLQKIPTREPAVLMSILGKNHNDSHGL